MASTNGHLPTRGSVSELGERYAAEAKDKVTEVAEQARQTSGELWDNALELIQNNPAASVGVAFLAGLAVAALMSGGSEKKSAIEKGIEGWGESKESFADSLTELRDYLDTAVSKLRA